MAEQATHNLLFSDDVKTSKPSIKVDLQELVSKLKIKYGNSWRAITSENNCINSHGEILKSKKYPKSKLEASIKSFPTWFAKHGVLFDIDPSWKENEANFNDNEE